VTAEADAVHMRAAIALARPQLGRTGSNPAVGCRLVRDGVVVGEGATAEGGRPHAEELALIGAGDLARGAAAYVTLEPCDERSSGAPSCSELLIAAGVARVIVAVADDPSPKASHRGLQRLKAAGVPVEVGLLADEAQQLYADYVQSLASPNNSR
jgi:diaminohydroxyphosphoribosylaminopyrimidine deaminase/5-amino-6-(5-phosphoribosylamino)uracil reductase